MSKINKIIAKRLKPFVEAQKDENGRKMKQQDIANKWNVSKNVLSKAINGYGLSVENAKNIAQHIGVTLDYIYGYSDYKTMEQYGVNILNRHLQIRENSNKYLCISNPLFEYLNSMYLIEQLEMLKKNKDPQKCEARKRESQEDFIKTLTNNSNDTDKAEKILIDYIADDDFHILDI